MAVPKSIETGKPAAFYTDPKNTAYVKTSQGGKMMAEVHSKPFNNPIKSEQRLTQGENGTWVLTGKDKFGKTVSIPWDLQKSRPLDAKPETKSGEMAKAKSGLSTLEGGGKTKTTATKKNLWDPKQYKPSTVVKSDGTWRKTFLVEAPKGKPAKILHQPDGAVTKVTLKDELSTPYEKFKQTV